jgi:hypothetical protein
MSESFSENPTGSSFSARSFEAPKPSFLDRIKEKFRPDSSDKIRSDIDKFDPRVPDDIKREYGKANLRGRIDRYYGRGRMSKDEYRELTEHLETTLDWPDKGQEAVFEQTRSMVYQSQLATKEDVAAVLQMINERGAALTKGQQIRLHREFTSVYQERVRGNADAISGQLRVEVAARTETIMGLKPKVDQALLKANLVSEDDVERFRNSPTGHTFYREAAILISSRPIIIGERLGDGYTSRNQDSLNEARRIEDGLHKLYLGGKIDKQQYGILLALHKKRLQIKPEPRPSISGD